MAIATNRRIVVGLTDEGRSTVHADARDIAATEPLPGFRVQEVGNKSAVPGNPEEGGASPGAIGIEPPSRGALVRILTIEPVPAAEWVSNLHGDSNRHVLTLVSGKVDLVLEDREVPMTPGDSVVLAGHVHDWRNTYEEPAVLVYTSFPLSSGSSADR